jgi:hypothetical protein
MTANSFSHALRRFIVVNDMARMVQRQRDEPMSRWLQMRDNGNGFQEIARPFLKELSCLAMKLDRVTFLRQSLPYFLAVSKVEFNHV